MMGCYTQKDILTMLDKEIVRVGLQDDTKISLTTLNRYVSQVLAKHPLTYKVRISKINSLPVEIKYKLDMWISSRMFTQREILERLNREIEISGLDDSKKISYSALNRWISKTLYNKRFNLK